MEEEEEDGYHFEEGDTLDELEVSYSYRDTTFLKVLCILTWIYSAIVVFIFIRYFGNAANARTFMGGMGNSAGTYFMFNFFLFPIICSVGAFFMFRRNKWGFIIYVFGQVPPILYKGYLFFSEGNSPEAVIPMLILNAFPIGFLIMYASQLKAMNKLRKPKSQEII